MNEDLIIALNGLPMGNKVFNWHLDKVFFDGFDNKDIIKSDIDVFVNVNKSGSYLGVDCDLVGNVVVECDRCLQDLVMPIKNTMKLSYKFGEAERIEDDIMEGDREVVYLPLYEDKIDLSQIVYDYVLLSIPMQRKHSEGECDPQVIRYIDSEETGQNEVNSPFAVLKGLINNKK